jgi:glycosyltransferase involved in cell wall biosynthesis
MRALLLAYYFPPDGGAGSQRPTSFARHLPGHGVECTVLTRSPPSNRNYFEPADASLLAAAGCRARIVRTPPAEGGMPGWLAELQRTADRLIAEESPDVLLLTMSPFEMWRVGADLSARHGVPAVFDLRDPWALDGVRSHRTWFHWRRELSEMRAMLRSAAGVVANTPECRRLFLEMEPRLAPERVAVVTNGWDRDDFPLPAPRVEPGAFLRLVFTGSFLCGPLYERPPVLRRLARTLRYSPEPIDPTGRTPLHLLRAMRLLSDRGADAGREIRFVVVGQGDEWLDRCVRESGVAERVEVSGYRPHDAVLRILRAADALFLTLHGLPPGRRSRIVPGKTYEYLAAGRPILGALPPGDARDFVEESGRGFCVDPCDDVALAGTLERLHGRWRRGELADSTPGPSVERFERSRLAGELADFLRDTVRRGRPRA